MGGTLCTFATFMRWIVRFVLGSGFIGIINCHTFLNDSDSVIDMPPEGGMASVGLKLVTEGEESCFADCAVVKPRRYLSPKFACKRSF